MILCICLWLCLTSGYFHWTIDIRVVRPKENQKEEETGFNTEWRFLIRLILITADKGSDVFTCWTGRRTLVLCKHKSSISFQCLKQFLPPSNSSGQSKNTARAVNTNVMNLSDSNNMQENMTWVDILNGITCKFFGAIEWIFWLDIENVHLLSLEQNIDPLRK